MKLKSTHLISGLFAATCAFTQTQAAPPSQDLPPLVIQGNKPTGEVTTPKQTFAELIEIEVLNFQNEKLGRIKAVTADLERGRLVEVLIGTRSGMLGMNETITPVPPSVLKVDARHELARINISKAQFDAAPKLLRSNATAYSEHDRAVASSRYFGVDPWFKRTGLGYVQTTSSLELMQIKNTQGQYMGKVGMVLMDLPTSRITKIVDDTESMDGGGSHILPVGSVHYNAKRTGLVLDRTFAELKNESHFRWVHGNGDDTHYVEELNGNRAVPMGLALQPKPVVQAAPSRSTVKRAVVVRKTIPQNSRKAASTNHVASR